MLKPQNIITFDEISEKYTTWIIEYYSTTFNNSLFMIWYRDNDENSTDKLLTYNDGQIFAISSLAELKTKLNSEINNIELFGNINYWLDNFKNLEITKSSTYDLISLSNNLDINNLDDTTLENFANFINLFNDFVNQDKRNNHLHTLSDDDLIQETYDYYYNFIFWPRFNDKEKFNNWERPRSNIDTTELFIKLKELIKTFEANIKFTEKAIC